METNIAQQIPSIAQELGRQTDPFLILVTIFLVALIPFTVAMVTSYTKVVVVLYIIRNAIGLQQAPSNIVLNSIAIILTVYVMSPIFNDTASLLSKQDIAIESFDDIKSTFDQINQPYKDFLYRFSTEKERLFFTSALEQLQPPESKSFISENDLMVLAPSFLVGEISRAFKIGLLVYLPFIVIDLIVANILLSLGMIMVSPLVISLPFKLFLFVAVDGWVRLLHGLVLSYSF